MADSDNTRENLSDVHAAVLEALWEVNALCRCGDSHANDWNNGGPDDETATNLKHMLRMIQHKIDPLFDKLVKLNPGKLPGRSVLPVILQ